LLISDSVFALANSRTVDGDYAWRTIGTAEKFVADEVAASWVYTGTLTAEQINAVEGIVLGANATIAWDELPSLPTASQVGAKPYDWVPGISDVTGLETKLTYIDGQGIYTGTLTAQQINAVQGIVLGSNATIEWESVSGVPTLSTVATTGNYNDLTNKPLIPSVPSYITSTKITQTTVESPTIRGGYLVGGKIFAVNTTTAEIVDGDIPGYKRLIIDSSGITSRNASDQLSGVRIASDTWGKIEYNTTNQPRGAVGIIPTISGTDISVNANYGLILQSNNGAGKHHTYKIRMEGQTVSFYNSDVDFTNANVTGLEAVAKFA
ncbi:MAG TPA: hypothetical protein GX717_07970, partial [Clostridiaceae bacterium]|nr:hypothetical protein [Clostridiaceae bacterium]